MHDPQVLAGPGPEGMADAISAYQQGAEGQLGIEEIFSAGDRVVLRWTGTGAHIGEVNGSPPTGNAIRVDASSVHRAFGGRIVETREVEAMPGR